MTRNKKRKEKKLIRRENKSKECWRNRMMIKYSSTEMKLKTLENKQKKKKLSSKKK